MTLTVELTPDLARRIETAKAKGIDVDALLLGVISSLPSATDEGAQATKPKNRTAELFAQWDAEDANMTPEEIAAEQSEWEAFKQRVNATRAETGERPFYK